MNIGIDIDDTISNSFETYFPDSQIYDIEKMNGTGKVKDIGKIPSHKYIETMYEWDEKSTYEFWSIYFEKVLKEATVKDHAAEVIKKLKEDGNNIYIITARYEQEGIDSVRRLTEEWLKNNNIVYDELIMDADNKLEVAQKYNIDVFIDDSLVNCKDVSKGNTKVLQYVGIGNVLTEDKDIQKVYSWPQIYNIIGKNNNK